MNELGERVARVETQIELMTGQLTHIDQCVDKLKKTVWQASGAAAAVVLIVQSVMKHI